MKYFKVLDPKGVHHNGAHFAAGETLSVSTPLSAAAQSFVHFKQVEEVDAPPAEPEKKPEDPEPKGKGGK
jgi:hypothetical protein